MKKINSLIMKKTGKRLPGRERRGQLLLAVERLSRANSDLFNLLANVDIPMFCSIRT